MSIELDIALRLAAATLIGAAVGLNRDLHGKPTGIRTLGLVGLGAALATLASTNFLNPIAFDMNPVSRAIQGVLTGIGFLGAGVIVRDQGGTRVQGLTTAAAIWLTAAMGVVCGLGAWIPVLVAFVLLFALLLGGGALEDRLHRIWERNH